MPGDVAGGLVAEAIAIALTVACAILDVVGGSILYSSLRSAGIDKVGSIGVRSFVGTLANSVFQVVLRYGPGSFRELVEGSASRRAHMLAYYSSRFLVVGIVALIFMRRLA